MSAVLVSNAGFEGGLALAEYTVSVHVCRTWQDRSAIQKDLGVIYEGLGTNIIEQTGITELGVSVLAFLRDSAGHVVGGVVGDIFGGWIYVSLLWVEKQLRGKGHGTHLLQTIEQEAVNLGCQHAHLDTYSFEARPLYEKHGYEVFATLDNYPSGHSKYFLKKRLK